MIGRRFGKLIVIARAEDRVRPDGYHRSRWLCQCDCGTQKEVLGDQLIYNKTRSCGCLRMEAVRKAKTKHGHGRKGKQTRTYRSWSEMIARCRNTKSKIYPYYGGRGISVCERWTSFENFLNDMGERPDNTSLDRIDNSGNYEVGNCRWATRKEQARNRRSNCMVTYEGQRMTLAEAAEREGVAYGRMYRYADADAIERRRAYKREWARLNRELKRKNDIRAIEVRVANA